MQGLKHFYLLIVALCSVPLFSGCSKTVVVDNDNDKHIAYDRRTTGTMIDDQIIEFKASARIASDKDLARRINVNVTSYNNILLLTGEVPTEAIRQQVETLASKVPKVRRIQNEIVVGALSTRSSRLRDSWITTKAKTSLFKIKMPGFNPTRIKVVTENRAVFLLGLVRPAEADAAVAQVSNISNVQKVVKVFEYIKDAKP